MNTVDIQGLVQLLRTLEPGKLPPEIFFEVARLTVTPIYEVVPLRLVNGQVEVLVLERPASDPVWGGQLHTPGTVIRANDEAESFSSAQDRIRKELGGVEFSQGPVYVEMRFHQVKRGREIAMIHWATLAGDPREGAWYSAGQLPKTLVETQRGFIASAVKNFLQHGH